ncbi:MAG: ATP-binding protein [Candidatus Eisenbacteria bacterium]
MNSLRARLIVAFSVVALVPLAIAMTLLGSRIEAMVKEEARERLGATLGTLQHQVETERKRLDERLAILGRDPQLKRLYLLRPGSERELSEYVAERRFLLALDFLYLTDATATSVVGERPSGGLTQEAEAAIRYQGDVVGIVHGGILFDRPLLERLGQTGAIELVLRDATGATIAHTLDPRIEPMRGDVASNARVAVGERWYWIRQIALEIGPERRATLSGLASTEPADRAVGALRMATLVLAALCLALAVVLGAFWSSQVSRPVERLAAFAGRVAEGAWDEPLQLRSMRELETLVEALDRMRRDLSAYREKLIVSERHAAWSQMARAVAHEVKNPLTPIAISIADLKRSYEQKRPDFPEILDQAARTIADEVETLKRLLQEFSEFARFPAPRMEPFAVSEIFTDLATLHAREIAEGRLAIEPPPDTLTLSADRGQLRQALLNLILNGLDAAGGAGSVTLSAARSGQEALLLVHDSGRGLAPEERSRLFAPGFTTKASGSGLGLTIVERIVSEHGGSIAVESTPGRGTTFQIHLPLAPGP